MTIDYVNPTKYGIWLTLSSIVGWIDFFDLGLGNGFRNKYAEAKALGDVQLAKQYVATTYVTICIIMAALFLILYGFNYVIDWSSILNVDKTYSDELSKVFFVLMLFFCINMVARLLTTILTADQRIGWSSMIDAAGKVSSLVAIYILTRVSNGSLMSLALFYTSVPTLFLVLCTIVTFSMTEYSKYKPRIKYVDFSLVRGIMNLGVQFFVIYLCLIAVFQIITIVISRELGSLYVTQYNIAYKYFFLLANLFLIVLTPFWSAFTEAYAKHEIRWMIKAKKSLERVWLCSLMAAVIMYFLADWFYGVWVGGKVNIDQRLSLMMMLYVMASNIGALYMYLNNGIGTVRIQMVIYLLFAIFSYPILVMMARQYGVIGVVAYPLLVVFTQAALGKIQIEKIIKGTARGIWLK